MSNNQSQESTNAESNWVPIRESLNSPGVSQLVPSYSCFHHLLSKHSRRLVQEGGLSVGSQRN